MGYIFRGGRTEAVAGDSWTDSLSAAWQYSMLDHDGTVTVTVGRTTAHIDTVTGIDVIDTDTRDMDELRRVLGSDAPIIAYADTIPGMTVSHTCHRQMTDDAVEIVGAVTISIDDDYDDLEFALAEQGLI